MLENGIALEAIRFVPLSAARAGAAEIFGTGEVWASERVRFSEAASLGLLRRCRSNVMLGRGFGERRMSTLPQPHPLRLLMQV